MNEKTPVIAIVGRPNVGKSMLFNRLIGLRLAIIAKEAGTTRDQISQNWDCNGYRTVLIDTGGLDYGKLESIEENVQLQARLAIESADIILFVVDGQIDPIGDDLSAAQLLRKAQKKVILIANKVDNPEQEKNIVNLYKLGFSEPIPVSAIHNSGIAQIKSKVEKELKVLKFSKKIKKDSEEEVRIAIIGKPNSGKSSLVNALLGSEKIIVSEIPGTTRDAIDTQLIYHDKKFILTDTAGIRRRGKIEGGVEKFSVLRAMSAAEKSEIIVLLIDGIETITQQDCHIAELALTGDKGLIIAVNKIDLYREEEEKGQIIVAKIKRKFDFIPWAPVVFLSAKNKTNIFEILNRAEEIMEQRKKMIPTHELNTFMQKITHKHLPASTKIQKPRFLYAQQIGTRPPRILFIFKNAENIHFSYKRYLENEIRKQFGFIGTGIEFDYKTKASTKKSK